MSGEELFKLLAAVAPVLLLSYAAQGPAKRGDVARTVVVVGAAIMLALFNSFAGLRETMLMLAMAQ